jgi:CheY-like chemotaxis protein
MPSQAHSTEKHRLLLIGDDQTFHAGITTTLDASDDGGNREFQLDVALQAAEGLAKMTLASEAGRPYAMALVAVRGAESLECAETIAAILEEDSAIQVAIFTDCADSSWHPVVAKLGNSDRLVILEKPPVAVAVLQLVRAMTAKSLLTRQARQASEGSSGLSELQANNEMLRVAMAEGESAHQMLKDSRERLAKAFDACPLPVAILRMHDHGCVEVNRAYLAATGYEIAEVLGRSPWDSGLSIDSKSRLEAMGELAGGKVVRQRPCQITPKGRDSHAALLWIEPFELDSGPHLIAIVHDVDGKLALGKEPTEPQAHGPVARQDAQTAGNPRSDCEDAGHQTTGIDLDVQLPGNEEPRAGGSEVILLVEDDDDLRGFAREILQEAGYRILEAADGHQAIAAWRGFDGHIDLLLTDMVMPGGLSGSDVAECFKLDRPEGKILYSSGYNADLFGSDITLCEGVNYLPKPYFAQQLMETVARVIEGRAVAA